MDCSQHAPPRIVPHCGQVSENSSKPSRSEYWGVFHEDVARSNLANDSCELSPEAGSRTVEPCAFSGATDVLAREAARNDERMADAAKLADDSAHSVVSLRERPHVVPNWERIKASVVLPGREDGASVGVELDGADGAPSKDLTAEDSATSAREKCQLIHFLSFRSGGRSWRSSETHPNDEPDERDERDLRGGVGQRGDVDGRFFVGHFAASFFLCSDR